MAQLLITNNLDSIQSHANVNANFTEIYGNLDKNNLAINPDFKIWQRGLSFSTNTLTADRWLSTSGNVARTTTQNNDGIKLTATTAGLFMGIAQKVEIKASEANMIINKTLTLSYKILASAPCIDYSGRPVTTQYVTYSSTFTVTQAVYDAIIANGFYIIEVGIWKLADGSALPIGFNFYVQWVKLEIGSIATPFVPRGIGEELLLCKRFYQIIGQGITAVAQDATFMTFGAPFSEMRIAPTPTLISTSVSATDVPFTAGRASSGSAISGYIVTKKGISYVNLTGFTGLTTGKQYIFSSENILGLDAEF